MHLADATHLRQHLHRFMIATLMQLGIRIDVTQEDIATDKYLECWGPEEGHKRQLLFGFENVRKSRWRLFLLMSLVFVSKRTYVWWIPKNS